MFIYMYVCVPCVQLVPKKARAPATRATNCLPFNHLRVEPMPCGRQTLAHKH